MSQTKGSNQYRQRQSENSGFASASSRRTWTYSCSSAYSSASCGPASRSAGSRMTGHSRP